MEIPTPCVHIRGDVFPLRDMTPQEVALHRLRLAGVNWHEPRDLVLARRTLRRALPWRPKWLWIGDPVGRVLKAPGALREVLIERVLTGCEAGTSERDP